ncbi:MAG TPA: 4'-phosphopantetheinyl transferase superfamily protein [Thermoanaerobaculia bacterium]
MSCFVGNDVVDVADPAVRGAAGSERERRDRHLTEVETAAFPKLPARAARYLFWSLFAAKEAAYKAFVQAGVDTPRGGYRLLEVDLEDRRVLHRPSGRTASIARLESDRQRIHCVVTAGDPPERALLLCGISRVPRGGDASEEVREALGRGLAAHLGGDPQRWAVGERDGAPRLLESGRWIEASISLAHSGRFAAYSAYLPART